MTAHDVRGTDAWQRVEAHFRALHEPVFGLPHRLSEPTVSADGAKIAVTGAVLDALEGLPRSAVYRVEGDGLVEVARSARQPVWSPDGSALAVLSDAATAGVHQLVVDGRPTPAVPGTVEYARWSPDGTKLLLGVAGLGADLAGGQGSGTTKRAEEELPAWFPSVTAGVSEEAWRSAWVHDVAAGTTTRWSPPGVNVWEAAWVGSDAALVVTSPQPDEGAWYTAVLQRLQGDSLTVAYTPEVQLGWPAGSPDGSTVAVVEAVCSDRWVVAGTLLVGAPGALEAVDTLGVDVTATQWLDDTRIGIVGLRSLETVAAVHDTATGKTTEVWSSSDSSCGIRYPEAAWTADGSAVVVEDGWAQPYRVVTLGAAATVHHTLPLRTPPGSAANVAWAAPDGLRLEGILCTPDGDGPFPLVVNVHGGPVWAYRPQWAVWSALTPLLVEQGYAVLSPNPRGSAGRGQEFARLVFGDMGGADTWDFTSAVDALVERGIADPARLGLYGGSYGGFMSAWLPTQDQRWAASVPASPVTDWYSQHFTSNIPFFDALFLDGDPEVPGDNFHARSPVAFASRVRTPCLNVAGALDRCTPPGQALEFHQALLEHGVESQCVIYPQEGHGVRAFPAYLDFATRVLAWFEKHMPASDGS